MICAAKRIWEVQLQALAVLASGEVEKGRAELPWYEATFGLI